MDLLVPQPRPKESNREYACRVLRMNIMTFRLKPGEPLSEIEIAKLFQMSRTPVHEAITTLHNDWLIEIFPQRGTQVSRIDPALVKEGYSTRLLLESALLKDVAARCRNFGIACAARKACGPACPTPWMSSSIWTTSSTV